MGLNRLATVCSMGALAVSGTICFQVRGRRTEDPADRPRDVRLVGPAPCNRVAIIRVESGQACQTLLADLATIAQNTIVTAITPNYPLTVVTRPTPTQHKAFRLLGLSL